MRRAHGPTSVSQMGIRESAGRLTLDGLARFTVSTCCTSECLTQATSRVHTPRSSFRCILSIASSAASSSENVINPYPRCLSACARQLCPPAGMYAQPSEILGMCTSLMSPKVEKTWYSVSSLVSCGRPPGFGELLVCVDHGTHQRRQPASHLMPWRPWRRRQSPPHRPLSVQPKCGAFAKNWHISRSLAAYTQLRHA